MGDIVKTVDRAELDRLIEKDHLHVRACPKCGGIVKLFFEFPTYGSYKAIFQCERCGESMQEYMNVECFSCDNTFATLHTAQSIGKSVLLLAEKWNSHAKTEYYLHEEKRQAYYRQKYGEAKSCITIDLEATEKTEVKANA